MRPTAFRKRVTFLTTFSRILLSLAARAQIFVRVKVTGRRNVPSTGAVIICANHISMADPIFLHGALRRNIAFMAADWQFRVPLFGKIMRQMGHIPVYRDTAKAKLALVDAVAVLRHGGLIGIFPEGKLSPDGRQLQARGGMADMAFRTGAPVVPVGIDGTHRFMPIGKRMRFGHRVHLNFGEPIRPPYLSDNAPVEDRRAFSALVMSRIASLSGLPGPDVSKATTI